MWLAPGKLKAVMTRRLQALKQKARARDFGYDLTPEWAVGRWAEQQGMCWYSGIPMTLTAPRGPLGLSFDRVDSECGYIRMNTVMCCHCINTFKSDMPLDQFEIILYRLVGKLSRPSGWLDCMKVRYPGAGTSAQVRPNPPGNWDPGLPTLRELDWYQYATEKNRKLDQARHPLS
jgi:hypothetical protein